MTFFFGRNKSKVLDPVFSLGSDPDSVQDVSMIRIREAAFGKPQKKFSGPKANKKKIIFLKLEKKIPQKMWPLSPRGGGGLSGRATKKELYFFAASLT